MDIAEEITLRLKQIFSRLKLLNIVRSYTLKIDFGKIEEDLKGCLIEVSGLLRKCVKKIRSKPRRAEIRNVIGVLVRKKNIKPLKDTQTKCKRRTVSELEINRQLSSEERFLCEFCGVKFLNYPGLKVHILKIHKPGEKLKSKKNICICTTEDKLEDHSKHHSKDVADTLSGQQNVAVENDLPSSGTETLPVDVSPGESNISIPSLNRDQEGNVENDAVRSFPCPHRGCQRIFQKLSSMKKHIRLKHGTKAEYQCSKCEKVFFEKGKLNRHILSHQPAEFQCSKCHKGFHRMDNLRRHIASHLENVKTFQCRFCEKTFSLKFNKDAHEANVHTKTNIQCELCDKKCKNEPTLKVHMRLHEENRISCSLCCKTFTRKAQYRNHLKNKHKGLSPFQKLFDSFATLGATSP